MLAVLDRFLSGTIQVIQSSLEVRMVDLQSMIKLRCLDITCVESDNKTNYTWSAHDGLNKLAMYLTCSVQECRPSVFVLSGVSGCGKTSAVESFSRMNMLDLQSNIMLWRGADWNKSDCVNRRVLRLTCCDQELSMAWFNREILGLSISKRDVKLSEHIRNSYRIPTFVTFVLDDFDKAIKHDALTALAFVRELHRDSSESGIFNLLVVCDDERNSIAVMDCLRRAALLCHVVWRLEDMLRFVQTGWRDASEDLKQRASLAGFESGSLRVCIKILENRLTEVPADVVYRAGYIRRLREHKDALIVFES